MLSKEEELYTVLELLAEIGGHVGLFLGFSVWSFAAWISDILELQIQKLQKEEQEDQNGHKEPDSQKPDNYRGSSFDANFWDYKETTL